MRDSLRELWKYRELLRQLVLRELKVRYKNSALGFFWSIVPPLLEVLVFTFLVRGVFGVPVPNYSVYLLCGLVPWTFFSTAILDASHSILHYYPVISKVYLPREVVPLSTVISNFIHFLLGWLVVFGAFFLVQPLVALRGGFDPIPFPFPRILLLPFLLAVQFCFVAGIALFSSALNVFFEDVKFVLQSLFRLLFFVVPVVFPAEVVATKLPVWAFKLYLLNPITMLITAYRAILLDPISPALFNVQPSPIPSSPPVSALLQHPETVVGACLLSFLIAWAGYTYFNSRKWQFMERG